MPADVVCLASWNADLLVRLPRPVGRGETLPASGFEVLPGGKGSNAAVACARQGARVALIARVGGDAFGRMGLALWKREGIDTRHVRIARRERSGVAQIRVYDGGDNSIAVAAGANAGLRLSQKDPIREARVILSSCEVPLATTRAAFAIARRAGVTTILNPAPARKLPRSLLALCDVLVPNETEFRELRRALRGRAVIVTLGVRGCALYRAGIKVLQLPGHRVKVVDTVGAGDTFVGALAAALARGEPLENAIRWANAAAALSVTGRGALGGMPTRRAVARMLGVGWN